MLAFSLILGLGLLASAALVTWRAADVAELDGMALGIWLTAMLLVCPLTWDHEITLMLPVYLLPVIYFVTRRSPSPKIGVFCLRSVSPASSFRIIRLRCENYICISLR
jgi:hypothetical protein